MFGARFKGPSLYLLYQKGNLIRIKTGLDTYLIRIQTRTPPSRYPPYDYSSLFFLVPRRNSPKKTFCRTPFKGMLSGPLNRLNAKLSLLQPLDRYRTPSAIGSAIGRPLSRPISLSNTGGSPQPPRSKPLGGPNLAIVVL